MSKILSAVLIVLTLSACSFPGTGLAVTPSPTLFAPIILSTSTLSPESVALTLTPEATSTPEAPTYCNDPQTANLLASFEKALKTSNGELLASSIHPSKGMDVRAFRNGRMINYDRAHAKFLFISTYQAPWGNQPASGKQVNGAFHEIIIPELMKVFGQTHTFQCRKIQTGGATYEPEWPYQGSKFFSAFFAGTETNGSLDWYTWVIGIESVNDKPYIYALVPFFWEP